MYSNRNHHPLTTFAVLCGLYSSALAQQDAGVPPSDELFLQTAARRLGADASDVTLGRLEGPVRLDDFGTEVYVRSCQLGDEDKTVVAITADGRVVDFGRARELDRQIGLSRRGKISRRLFDEAASRPGDERVPVVAWIAAPSLADIRETFGLLTEEFDSQGQLTREIAETHEAEISSQIRERIDPVTRDAEERFRSAGFEVLGRDEYVPIVFLAVNASELLALQTDPSIESVDWAGTDFGDRLNVAVGEVRAYGVWSAPGGVTGVGARVSIVEGGTVCDQHPFMPLAAVRLGGWLHNDHTTGVASCVAGNHGTYKGVAPGATLLSANGADFVDNSTNVTTQMPQSVAAVSWSVAQGAHILNLSYGAANPGATVSSFDRYLDWIARNNAKTICIAAGNSGNFAGDPGAGFNQIAVGSFNDMGNSVWAGESMAASSSWRNPVTGVETPQVAAPGVNITMLKCSTPWFGYTNSGTSFASPLTAGECALLVSKQPALGSWPEAVRAIVMATAWHNIEGLPRLSSKDGAGGIDAIAAFRVASRLKGVGYNYGSLTATSFDANGYYQTQTASALAGQTVRVCLSFDSTPTGGPAYTQDNLLCDLDLYVYGPTGALVATSTSSIQPFEIVQFTAPATCAYKVKIRKYSFTGTSEFYGTAFTTNADM